MLEPIKRAIEVPCGQEEAFVVFLEEMHTWWPMAKFSVAARHRKPAGSLRVEPRIGGAIVEMTLDGKEHRWGTVTMYDPYGAFTMDFHIGMPAKSASVVEVCFIPLADGRTRVELTQSCWERFGKAAAMMFDGYSKGWVVIFDGAYRAACSGLSSGSPSGSPAAAAELAEGER